MWIPTTQVNRGLAFSGVRVWKSNNTSLPDDTVTLISFNTEEYDTDGYWSPGTPDTITIPRVGKYLIVSDVRIKGFGDTSALTVDVLLNNEQLISWEASAPLLTVTSYLWLTTQVQLQAGDELQLQCYQLGNAAGSNALPQGRVDGPPVVGSYPLLSVTLLGV